MEPWVAADDIIRADVIRWTEGVFSRRGRRKKSQKVGERQVIAEVLKLTDDGWLMLLIRRCTITRDEFAGGTVPTLKVESEVRRAVKTVLRGKPERLLWSDESARDDLLRDLRLEKSRFLPRGD
jgi:hypothetical protein